MGKAMVESEKSAKELAPLLPLYNNELVRADSLIDIIIENVPVGILVTDTQGRILLANSMLGEFLGQDLPTGSDFASIGKLSLCHPGYTPADQAELPFLKFILEGKPIPGIDMMCSVSDGNSRDLLVNTYPIFGDNDQVMGAMAVFQDISDNQQKPGNNRKYGKLLEKEIRQSYDDVLASEEKFFKVFENLKWGVALLDNEGRILTSNMSLQEMLGYQKEALAGLHFHDLFIFSEREDDEKMKDLFHTLSTDKINHYQVEKCYALQNGQRRWFEVTVSHTKVFGDNGSHPWIAMAVINDITERLTLQQRLIKIDKLNIIDRLGLSLAHEINNPLQSALGSLGIAEEILEKDNEAHRFLIIAIEELERVVEIVRYLRDLGSKPEMEKRVSIDVNTLVNKTLTLTEKHALNSQVEIDWQPVENLPLVPEVSGLLIQVFTNLVINAIQAMPDGGRLKIRTVPTDEPCGVNITFADTGVGIAPETLSRLFEPFHSTRPIGFGLGLYICQKNVEDLGGRIEVESQLGAGTTFTVWLPC